MSSDGLESRRSRRFDASSFSGLEEDGAIGGPEEEEEPESNVAANTDTVSMALTKVHVPSITPSKAAKRA